jgi:predicted RecB family nuclease
MITNNMLVDFLNCRRKAFLKAAGSHGVLPNIERVQLDRDRAYRQHALEVFLSRFPECDVLRDPLSLEAAMRSHPRVIVNAIAESDGVRSQIQALERVEEAGGRKPPSYAPVLFLKGNKVTRSDKLLLGLNALALSSVQGVLPPVAKLVHGSDCRILRVKMEPLVGEVKKLLGQIGASLTEEIAPRVNLNSHCNVCEFRDACRKVALEADDLSLLRGLSEKEIEKQRSRGVTTVTQFSYTYRPGRRGKKRWGKARKHDQALQALAIREKKVYVLETPTVPCGNAALYLDIEGIPDQDFYYLIGLVVVMDGRSETYSFWAEDRTQEKAIWDACSQVINSFEDYTLYHYGRYELRFLDRMRRLADEEGVMTIDRIRGRSFNVLAAIYSHIYFPTWSNGLKDVGSFLGAQWSDANASGMQSISWRLAWESNRDEATKQRLLTYNREDCMALRRVTEFVQSVCGDRVSIPTPSGLAIASVEDLQEVGSFRFGKTQFFCPELAHINKCAYSNYQREKVYLRTSPAVRKSLRRKQRVARKRLRENAVVECDGPQICPQCGSDQVRSTSTWHAPMRVWDLKFTPSGVRRWVARYRSLRYACSACKKTFYAAAYRNAMIRIGNNLASWVIYQHVALRLSYRDLNVSLNEVFGFQFTHTVLGRVKPWMAGRHQATYERLKDRLRRGNLIHADETKVLAKGRPGYVWAFTNLEEVVYAYTPTREGTILEELLDGFTGVLVSDFYSAYDAPGCKQQKCLIHLIRDVNDDIFHHPFDEELKKLAQKLVGVLKPVIDTIDRYGLKQYHLNKHKEEVARYFRYLSGETFGSEVARKYQKRLHKYRDKLFVFLDHDGIPWNNNNAENAIKLFASRRKLIGSSFTKKGLKDYLVFLSIYQTCRNKNVSFPRFMRSGTFDIDQFAEGATRSRASPESLKQ